MNLLKKNIYFIHIPKNAGSSIIETYEDLNILTWGHNIRNESYVVYGESYKYKLSKITSTLFGKRSCVSFTIVRNPWDRVYSAYNFLKMGGIKKEDNDDFIKYIKPYKDFNHFVREGLEIASQRQLHFMSQLFWITNNKGETVVDTILKFENLEKELHLFMSQFDIPNRELKLINKKNFDNYKKFYSEESIEIVRDIYSEDINKFNYNFI